MRDYARMAVGLRDDVKRLREMDTLSGEVS